MILQKENIMKKIVMIIALLLCTAALISCVGPSPRPVIIQDGKEVRETR